MLKIINILILLLFSSGVFLNPDFKLKSIVKLRNTPEIFSTDTFGNIYVYENKLLQKYDTAGKLLATFSENTSNPISYIDVTDPFNILLFYENLNSIVFLDNNLSMLGNLINLDKLGFYSAKTVCKSKHLAIWVLDDFENKLIQYGFKNKNILRQIHLNHKISKKTILREQSNYIYLQHGNNNIYVYDNNGILVDNLVFENKIIFQLKGENIMLHNEKYIFLYNVINKQTDSLHLGDIKQFNKLRIENELLFVLKNDSVFIYE